MTARRRGGKRMKRHSRRGRPRLRKNERKRNADTQKHVRDYSALRQPQKAPEGLLPTRVREARVVDEVDAIIKHGRATNSLLRARLLQEGSSTIHHTHQCRTRSTSKRKRVVAVDRGRPAWRSPSVSPVGLVDKTSRRGAPMQARAYRIAPGLQCLD